MKKSKYSKAAVEVLYILNYMNEEDIKKIPQSFIEFLMNIADSNYKIKFNVEQTDSNLELMEESKELLGFIYITWWSDKTERNIYKEEIQKYKSIL